MSMIYTGDSFGYGRFLGKDPISIDQAIDELNLGTVSTVPIFTENGQKIRSHRATIRDGHEETYSVVGRGFTPVQDRDAFSILGEDIPVVGAGSLRDGAKVWLQTKTGTSEIVPGDSVDQYMMVVNAHDGSGSLKVFSCRKRAICNNMIAAILSTESGRGISIKHTRNVDDRVAQIRDLFEYARKYHERMNDFERLLAQTPLTRDQFEQFARVLIPDPSPKVRKNARKEKVAVQYAENVRELTGAELLDDLMNDVSNKVQAADIVDEFIVNENNTRAENNRKLLWECLEQSAGQSIVTPSGRPVSETLWGAKNAVTNYTNYHKGTRRTKGASEQERRFESAIFGSGAQMVAQADSLLIELLNDYHN